MYRILYTREAKSVIDALPAKKKRQIKDATERIAGNPEIGKRLAHELQGLWSYRSGVYRILYRIYHNDIVVIILTIGHRKDVYKKISRAIAS